MQGVGGHGGVGQGGGAQQLRAVGDDALEHAGEDIQQGGGAAGIHPVLLGHVTGHVAGHDDGHGVVGGGAVAQGDHGGDADLGGLVALHDLPQLLNDPGDAAVFGDEFRHTAAQQRQEEYLVHAGEAVPHALGEGGNGQITAADAHQTGGEDTHGQGQEHVEPAQGQDQHQHVGQDLDEIAGQGLQRHDRLRTAEDQQKDQGDQCRRQSDEEVDTELVAHFAALAAGGSDGGVGDHGEVVAEHGAAHHGTDDHGERQAAFFRNTHGDGDHGGDGTHGGAGGGAHKGGDDEQTSGQEFHRYQGQTQIYRGFAAAHDRRHVGEGTGQNVDHQHGEDVHVGGTLGKGVELLVNGALEHDKGRQHRQEHGGDGGELVKGHLHTLYLVVNTGAHVDDDEHREGEQRQPTGPLFVEVFHSRYPFFLSKQRLRRRKCPRCEDSAGIHKSYGIVKGNFCQRVF